MNMWLLNTVPILWLGVIVVALALLVSIAGLRLVRRFVRPSELVNHNNVAGLVYTAVVVIYGVLLPFVVADVWGEFRAAENATSSEALALEGLIVDAAQFSEAVERDIRRAVQAYVLAVVNEEWERMAWGEESQSARRSFRDIGLTLRTAEVESPREQAVFAAMLGQIERIAEHRDARIVQSRTHLPSVIWALIVFGGGIVITYTYLYGVQLVQSHMVMIAALATIIATVATVIMALDYPFSGDLRVRPDYFERVLTEIEVTASPPSLSP